MKRLVFSILFLGCFFQGIAQTKLIGSGTFNGGSIFSIEPDGSNPEMLIDFTVGIKPLGDLIESNGKLWGITQEGGLGYGIIFSINTDGTGYTKVHNFDGLNGFIPTSGLLESNGKLWGVTNNGGSNDYGTIYSINTDGTGFAKVHDFDETNGRSPVGTLIESNGKIWGLTQNGGDNSYGTIFNLNTDGSGFTKIHDFGTYGSFPQGRLVEANGKLYGTTGYIDGTNGDGIIFSIETNGTNFTEVYEFTGANGSYPNGDLIEDNGKLWGTTRFGGTSNNGTIFSLTLVGSIFQKVHDFDGTNGQYPDSGMIISGGKFWGTTPDGFFNGAAYSLNLDGTGFSAFAIDNVANSPSGNLVESNGRIWGAGTIGGYVSSGTLFSMNTDGTDVQIEHYFFYGNNRVRPFSSPIVKYGKLWGTANGLGTNVNGSIYRSDLDGSNLITLIDLNEENGNLPSGKLFESNGSFWGTTKFSTTIGAGVLFKMDLCELNFEVIKEFNGGPDGGNPEGSFIESNGKLWGVNSNGAGGKGVLFSMDLDGSNYTVAHSFNDTDGFTPAGDLVEANGKLWGVTSMGGANSKGTIYCINTNGTGFTKVHDFGSASSSGYPEQGLILANNKLWGMSYDGGISNYGTIYTIETNGTGFTVVHSFDDLNGKNPKGGLLEYNSKIYGLTFLGGTDNMGVIFSIEFNGTGFTNLHNFDGVIGGLPFHSSLVVLEDKLEQNVTFDVVDKVYGDTDFLLTSTSNTGNSVSYISSDETILDLTNDLAAIKASGEVQLTALIEGDGNYHDAFACDLVEVSNATLTVTADDKTITYGEDPVLTMRYEGFEYADSEADITTPSISSSYTEAGTAPITLSGGSASNYDLELQDGTLTIDKALLTVISEDKTITFGDNEPNYTFDYTGFVFDDDESVIDLEPSGAELSEPLSNAGTYIIQAIEDASDNNYEFTYIDGTLTVAKASQTISFDPLPTDLNEESEDFSLIATASSSLTVSFESDNSNVVSITGTTASILSPGSITITASQAGDINYESASNVEQTLIISEIITALGLKEYNGILEIYPNPASAFFSINSELIADDIRIVDLKGRTIASYKMEQGKQYSLVKTNPGTYLVIIVKGKTDYLGGVLIVK